MRTHIARWHTHHEPRLSPHVSVPACCSAQIAGRHLRVAALSGSSIGARRHFATAHYVGSAAEPSTGKPTVRVAPLLVKEQLMRTQTYQQLLHAVEAKPLLHDDWLSLTSRPWMQGPIDALLANPRMAAFAARQPQLQQRVAALVDLIDQQLLQVALPQPAVPTPDSSLDAGVALALPAWKPATYGSMLAAPAGATTATATNLSPGGGGASQLHRLGHDSGRAPSRSGNRQSSAYSPFVSWLVSVVERASNNGAIYTIVEAMELLLTEDKVAALERFSNAAVTEPRLMKLVAVLEAALTPPRVAGAARELMALLTEERVDRLMAVAELVLGDEHRILTAGTLVDDLMALVSIDSALGLTAAVDRAFNVQLQSQLLGAALDAWGQPGTGDALGELLDVVMTEERVQLYAATTDQVLSEERLAQLPELLAAVAPALDAAAIGSFATTTRAALGSKDLHQLLTQLQQQLTPQRVEAYMAAVDCVVDAAAVGELLDAAGVLLSNGRWWLLQGKQRPRLLPAARRPRSTISGANSNVRPRSSSAVDREEARGGGSRPPSAFAVRYGRALHDSSSDSNRSSGSSAGGGFQGVGGDPFYPHSLPGRASPAHWGVAPLHVYTDAELEAILNHYLPSSRPSLTGYTLGDVAVQAGADSSPAAAAVSSQLLYGDCVGDDCVMCTFSAPPAFSAAESQLLRALQDPALLQLVFAAGDEVMQPRMLQQLSACLQQALQPQVMQQVGLALDEVLHVKELSSAHQGPSCSLQHQLEHNTQGRSSAAGRQRHQPQRLSASRPAAAVMATATAKVLQMDNNGTGTSSSTRLKVRPAVRALAATAASPLQQQHLVAGLQAAVGIWAALEHSKAAAGDVAAAVSMPTAALAWQGNGHRLQRLAKAVGKWLGASAQLAQHSGRLLHSTWCWWWALHTNLALEC